MHEHLPDPDIRAQPVPLDQLDSTAASIARASEAAGWTLHASRALGPRLPRTPTQTVERQTTLTLIGTRGRWAYIATHSHRDGWDVILHRPGWPPTPSTTTEIRAILKAHQQAQEVLPNG